METYIDKKFYVPDISEFYVGFEYEWSREGEGATDWTKSIMTISNGSVIDQDAWKINKYRVKYLDKEDIESLEFITRLEANIDKPGYSKDESFLFTRKLKNLYSHITLN